MMQWVVLVTAAYVTGVTLEQPNPCHEDSQCAKEYYCDTDAFRCQECLQCKDLRRETPESKAHQCIKSVSECGLCLKGLVTDRLAGGAGCTEPELGAEAGAGAVPVWVWAGALVLAVLAIALAALIYALRHTDSIKFTTRTSLQAPGLCANGGGASAPAHGPSAPAPPPYFSHYAPVRPASPDPPPPATNPYTEESELPLVKRRGSERGGAARESAVSQNARVYSNPNYVRNVPPPSYDSAFSDESDHETPFVTHDEDTMESVWTPNVTNGDVNGNDSAAAAIASVEQETASGPLVPARRAERADAAPPPGKIRRVEQDTNNNEGGPSSQGPHPHSAPAHHPPPLHSQPPPPAPAAPSFVINVLNVNSVHQLNDVSL